MKFNPSFDQSPLLTVVPAVFFLAVIVTVGVTVSIFDTVLLQVPTFPAASFTHALYVPFAVMFLVFVVPNPLVALVHEYPDDGNVLPPVSDPFIVNVADVVQAVLSIVIVQVGTE